LGGWHWETKTKVINIGFFSLFASHIYHHRKFAKQTDGQEELRKLGKLEKPPFVSILCQRQQVERSGTMETQIQYPNPNQDRQAKL